MSFCYREGGVVVVNPDLQGDDRIRATRTYNRLGLINTEAIAIPKVKTSDGFIEAKHGGLHPNV